MQRGNWLGFKSLLLGFSVRPYGQGLGSGLEVQGLDI